MGISACLAWFLVYCMFSCDQRNSYSWKGKSLIDYILWSDKVIKECYTITRGGSRIPRRREAPTNKFSQKLHKIKKILVWGAPGEPPLDPSLITNVFRVLYKKDTPPTGL